MSDTSLNRLAQLGVDTLAAEDPDLFDLLTREYLRQANVLSSRRRAMKTSHVQKNSPKFTSNGLVGAPAGVSEC